MESSAYKSPYRKNISDNNILARHTYNEQKKRAVFNIRVAGNKCRFIVWTNIENDLEGGKIEFVVSFPIAMSIIQLLEDLLEGKNGTQSKVEILRLGKGGYKEGKLTAGFIHVGKNDEGILWIALEKKGRPKIQFKFDKDDWANYMHKSGEQFSKEEAARIVASSWINIAKRVIPSLAVQEYTEITAKPYGNKNNSSKDTSSFDTDNSYDDDIGF